MPDKSRTTAFLRGEEKVSSSRGQGLVEYALLFTAVAIIVLVVLLSLGPAIGNTFNQLNQAL